MSPYGECNLSFRMITVNTVGPPLTAFFSYSFKSPTQNEVLLTVFSFSRFSFFFFHLFNNIFGLDSTLKSAFGRHPFLHSQPVQGSKLPADCGTWFFLIYFYCLLIHHIAPFSNMIFAYFSFFLHYVSLLFALKLYCSQPIRFKNFFIFISKVLNNLHKFKWIW